MVEVWGTKIGLGLVTELDPGFASMLQQALAVPFLQELVEVLVEE